MEHEINIENGKISIIIPTYNRKETLKESIDSILKQTYYNYEIIIVDDCSNDGTEQYINDIYQDNRIRYFKNKQNSGAGYSRKFGYSRSVGEYIIFCDDDDYYIDNNFFEEAIKIFKNKEISLICSNSYIKYEKENQCVLNKLNFKNEISVEEYLENFQISYKKPNSTFSTVFRKSILEKSNFNNMNMVNDSSIYLRALISGGKVYLNEKIIGIYRIHSKNITFNLKADFLIENLKEKKYIYEYIKEHRTIDNTGTWFEKQILMTVNYFLSGTNPSKKEMKKVNEWIKENTNKSKKILFIIKTHIIKIKVKNFIKMLVGRKK